MIRIIIENMLLFLLPTFAYLGWVMITRPETIRRDEKGRVRPVEMLNDAPLLWLASAGALLVVVTLIAFGTTSGGKPGQHYYPPVLKDGRIEPGHIE